MAFYFFDRPQGEWDIVAELMMIKFGESGHPVFRATSPFSRGTLKSKGGGKLSIHFCVDGDTIETVFRTIISVNQLSIYNGVDRILDDLDTEEFSQFTESVACREYILPRDEKSSDPKGWIRRMVHQNWTRIGSHNQRLPTRTNMEWKLELNL